MMWWFEFVYIILVVLLRMIKKGGDGTLVFGGGRVDIGKFLNLRLI